MKTIASILLITLSSLALGAADAGLPDLKGTFRSRAPWSDTNFFPIAVWLQSPDNAEKYRAAGINTYVGLWKGPTEEQLTKLKAAGMRLICEQNELALKHRNDPMIIAWMHGDEPDNAQSLGEGKGYGPPISPEKIVEDYKRLREKDPSRPVMLNLGQGVAWDGWYGRGTRTKHSEDYPQYIEGCDIVSFDIYPAVHDRAEIAGKLWYVPLGVERLVKWSQGRKLVWNCLECTRISNPDRKPTPQEVRCEAWMSLIHGSQGLIYFVHQFQPRFREAALLDDPDMLSAVTALNHQISQLAPVLNSPTVDGAVQVNSSNADVPVASMVKKIKGETYLFCVAMRPGQTTVGFRLQGTSSAVVEVLGETRQLKVQDGAFKDDFKLWDAHVYRVKQK